MPKIIIQEQKIQPIPNEFLVTVNFDGEDEFGDLTVHDPFSDENRRKLEWHFEKYVIYPYLKDVASHEAANIIKDGGETLFNQLFDQRDIYNRYRQSIADGVENLVIEISGSPEFHSIHWESLKDPAFPHAFALSSLILRKDLRPQSYGADVREATTINLLVVTSRPDGRNDVGYRTISRPLVELLRNAQLPVKVHILRPATYESLDKHLNSVGRGFYHVVHFDVHGALINYENFEKLGNDKSQGSLIFQTPRYGRPQIEPYAGRDAFLFLDFYCETENANDGFSADPVRADELANLLLVHGVPLVILNACQSAKEIGSQKEEDSKKYAQETSLASRLMRAGVQMVLAMSYSITVTAAKIMMENLYKEIFRNESLQKAIKIGRSELFNQKMRRADFNYEISLEDWLLPVVYQKRNVELKTKALTPHEEEVLLNERAELNYMPEVEYGFHGRDIDILNIERRVLLKNNILLIHGMGGAGKTTLLKHLAWWWQTTGFIGKFFYFGYDEKAYTRQEIMFRIAESLYDRFEFSNFQAMNETAQQQKLALKLRNEKHLLILDNLESIQGGYFAVKNTLSAEEQTKLKDFLAELRGTGDPFQPQTIVLLGSRNAEDWLKKETFNENLYDLAGLDRESATQFAEEISRKNGVSKYRTDDDFKKLLKLLAGFPLPIKVIFENLKRQTPAEILSALKAGDVNLNTGTAGDKTADILKCIEYSYSNISPEKQDLLLCLAPFTSVINLRGFERYIEELKKHEALAHLQHELWGEVFAESVERGLILLEEGESFFLLQPIFPYFLKTKWQKIKLSQFKQSVNSAFCDYFIIVSASINHLMSMNEMSKKKLGEKITYLEFENIDTCLENCLSKQISFYPPFLTLIHYYQSIQDHHSGLDLCEKVLDKMKDYDTDLLAGDIGLDFIGVLDSLASFQLSMKNYSEAESSYKRVLNLDIENQSLTESEKNERNGKVLHQLGIVAQEQREWTKAEDYYKQALEIFIEFQDQLSQAHTFNQLGIVNTEQEKWNEATDYLKKSLKIFTENNDPYRQSYVLHQLGILAQRQLDWDNSENYFTESLKIKIKLDDRHSQASTLHQLGKISQYQKEYSKAEYYYEQALKIFIEFNDRLSQVYIYHQLGSIAQDNGELEKAESYYNCALEIKKEFNAPHFYALTLGQLGTLKIDQAKFAEAEYYLLLVLRIFIDFDDKYNLAAALRSLGDLWEKTNNHSLITEISKLLGTTETQIQEMFKRIKND